MKISHIIGITLATLVASACSDLWGQMATPPVNPYASTAGRNVFGLVPDSRNKKEPVITGPLPQITICGTTTILGRAQVLFKVAGVPKPGITVTETSHDLGVGEMELNVKVIEISPDGNSVTFDNNGIIQVLQLQNFAKPWKPATPPPQLGGSPMVHFGSYRPWEHGN